jgi:hypothetical protein
VSVALSARWWPCHRTDPDLLLCCAWLAHPACRPILRHHSNRLGLACRLSCAAALAPAWPPEPPGHRLLRGLAPPRCQRDWHGRQLRCRATAAALWRVAAPTGAAGVPRNSQNSPPRSPLPLPGSSRLLGARHRGAQHPAVGTSRRHCHLSGKRHCEKWTLPRESVSLDRVSGQPPVAGVHNLHQAPPSTTIGAVNG